MTKAKSGYPKLIRFKFMLCPFVMEYNSLNSYSLGQLVEQEEWKAAYVFGIRVAAWRVNL